MGGGKLIPGREGVSGTKSEGAAEIDDPQTGLQESGREFSRNLVRRGEKRGRCAARDNLRHGKGAERSFANAAELGKKLSEAIFVLRVADVEDWKLHGGMAQENARQLETCVAGDTYYGDLFRLSHFTSDSIFFWRDSRDFLFGVMIRTVSSPAMLPAVSGNLAPSTAAARGCAPLGGVFKTNRFSAGRMSTRNSPSARAREGKPLDSSGKAAAGR